MPDSPRIALRLLGMVLLVLCAACLVPLFRSGPAAVAQSMGGAGGDFDAVSVLSTVIWVSFVAEVALRIGTRQPGREPRTLDLRWLRER